VYRRKVVLFLLIVSACIGIALISVVTQAETPAKKVAEDSTDFGNGILMIQTTTVSGVQPQVEMQALSDAKLVKLGGRYFLRGKAVIFEESNNYDKYKMLDGSDIAYDWKYVTKFYVLSKDTFKAHVKALTEKD
jgi:hypothetical protein